MTGHSDFVTSVSFSPDGKFIASGSWDKTIKIWAAAYLCQPGVRLGAHHPTSASLVSSAAIHLHAHACAAAAQQFLRLHAPQPAHGSLFTYYGWMNIKAMAQGRKCNGYLCFEAVGATVRMARSPCAGERALLRCMRASER